MTSKKIYILGESHTRSFCFRKNVMPIFLSTGKIVNFKNHNYIIDKVMKVWDSGIINNDDMLCLYLGEPDTRYQLGYKWYPHYENMKTKKLRIVKSKVNKKYLDKVLKTYVDVLRSLHTKGIPNIYVISPTGSYPPVLDALSYFNDNMKKLCEDISYVTYIDIFTSSLKNKKLKSSLLPPNGLTDDPIHLNSLISKIFIKMLKKKGIIKDVSNYKMISEQYNSFDVKNKFKVDQRFGSLTLKENK